ncbi:MAG: hypothetical protein IPN20_23400 [Haliscomenobacter sp.]|nr:hypothetical protein [Haliscomenobacter sp.]
MSETKNSNLKVAVIASLITAIGGIFGQAIGILPEIIPRKDKNTELRDPYPHGSRDIAEDKNTELRDPYPHGSRDIAEDKNHDQPYNIDQERERKPIVIIDPPVTPPDRKQETLQISDITVYILPSDSKNFSEVSEEFLSQLNNLTLKITRVASGNFSSYGKETSIQNLVKDFKQGASIQVSSINKNRNQTYPIRDYFNRISELKTMYDSLNFLFSNLKVETIYWDRQNKYFADGLFTQEFRGYKNGELIYGDITTKIAEMELTEWEDYYKIKYGNIYVFSTQPIEELKHLISSVK